MLFNNYLSLKCPVNDDTHSNIGLELPRTVVQLNHRKESVWEENCDIMSALRSRDFSCHSIWLIRVLRCRVKIGFFCMMICSESEESCMSGEGVHIHGCTGERERERDKEYQGVCMRDDFIRCLVMLHFLSLDFLSQGR